MIFIKFIRITFCFLLILFSTLFGQIKIKAVGDIMLGSVTPKTVLPADSGKTFVNNISKYLTDADIVFGNLEGTFILEHFQPTKCTEPSRTMERCFEFGMPAYLAPVLKQLNFNILNIDNNHSNDYGFKGYDFTKQLLSELNINYVGKKEPKKIFIRGKEIIIVPFGFSEISYNVSDINNAKKVITELKTKSNLIIVSFHGGKEGRKALHVKNKTELMYGENRGNLVKFSHAVIDAGADIVIGHGPHVLRAFELYKNRLIAYSLGNFLTYGNMNIDGVSGIAGILDVDINEITGEFISGNFNSVQQVENGYPVIDDSFAGFNLIKKLTKDDFSETQLEFIGNGQLINKPPLGGL
ncbi:MAG: hypothetical protein CO128_00160 [Ignavibacteriales bacterium CG_4_9_14_3_um_filter_30_11]|nr:MAG: hypothetical protein CO128_00160 [Ignavibacteriales bacterium CG_4_9_14_3_um_filter_30_11]